MLAERVATGVAVMLVTHEARFASFADRIVTLRDGRIVEPLNGRDVMGGARA
jgi:putative ABC transport system ATP-binding protein